ncbi:MAG: isocitrate lyase/phosphoenolpyruvate mutase family protein [Henriciella sp.]
MTHGKKILTRLALDDILVAPGIYDALSAHLAQQAGFEAVFLSGSSVAYSALARPDIGLVTMNEMAEACARITDRIDIPVLVDVDSGFGNAAHAGRTMRVMEKAGAAAIQIEDQQPINPVNDLKGRPLISPEAMVDKIKALTDDRRSSDVLISARSDSPASEPLAQTIDRIGRYCEAGADLVFAEGLKSGEDVEAIVKTANGIPVIYNLLHVGREISSAAQLQALGISVALFPGNAILSAAQAIKTAFKDLKENPSLPESGFSLSPKELNDDLEAPELIARYKDFAS